MDEPNTFTIAHARGLVADLFRPNPRIYWADCLASLAVGYAGAAAFLFSDGWPATAGLVVAALALYRASLFMHEIAHLRPGEMRGFVWCWNLLAGIPMLTPSFLYESHRLHHGVHTYGTDADGEYLPLGRGRATDVALFLAQILVQPLLVMLRFLCTPFTFVHPAVRAWTLEHTSSLVINFRYHPTVKTDAHRAGVVIMDLLCSARAWTILVLPLAGLAPWTHVLKLYVLAISILTLNYVRTLAAHRYLNDGARMSHEEQLSDSICITGNWLTELICPVGLRYHALHHLFPALPYHNLATAHRRLIAGLPTGSPYHQAVRRSVVEVLGELLRHTRARSFA